MGTFFFFGPELHIILKLGNHAVLAEVQEQLTGITGLDDMFVAQVPRQKPHTRSQFVEAQKYWPCHFHEDKRYVVPQYFIRSGTTEVIQLFFVIWVHEL